MAITPQTEINTHKLSLESTYGNFQAWTSNMYGAVINTATGKVVKRFRGEMAWSDADRYAGDADVEARLAARGR